METIALLFCSLLFGGMTLYSLGLPRLFFLHFRPNFLANNSGGVSRFLFLCVFYVGYFGGVVLFFRPNSGRRDGHNRGSDRSYEANSYAGNKPSF